VIPGGEGAKAKAGGRSRKDVAFLITAYFCKVLRGHFRQLSELVVGREPKHR
jgi:hypothetical protein